MNFEKGFIKNEDFLLERSDVTDLLDLSSQITEFSEKIDKISDRSVFALKGAFGEGKSTFINNVKLNRLNNGNNELWIDFDAWKYPNRGDLWEGFILDFAKQVSEDTFIKARKKIDGSSEFDSETLMKTLGGALGTFIPGGNIVSNLSHFFRSSPAKRVFEIQDLFVELLSSVKHHKIILVIEDIDRSGDAGIFFLETLKQFLQNQDFSKEIIAIVPIGTPQYEKNADSYLKPVDYFDDFSIQEPGLEDFVKELFIDEITTHPAFLCPLVDFLEGLFKFYPQQINIRKLKLILRKANQNHKVMYGKYNDIMALDWRLNIIFEASKYIVLNNQSQQTQFESYCSDSRFNNNIFGAYAYNLFAGIEWAKNRLYIPNNHSLYKNDDSLSTASQTIEIVDHSITEKGIVGGRFDVGDLKALCIHKIYLKY